MGWCGGCTSRMIKSTRSTLRVIPSYAYDNHSTMYVISYHTIHHINELINRYSVYQSPWWMCAKFVNDEKLNNVSVHQLVYMRRINVETDGWRGKGRTENDQIFSKRCSSIHMGCDIIPHADDELHSMTPSPCNNSMVIVI